MANDKIVIKGAREHNLKNVNLTLPREKLIVMTGLSGSGKSSLAFDTIYADGQRRYVESLSSYARMFLFLLLILGQSLLSFQYNITVAILGIAVPLLIGVIQRIDDKYESTRLIQLFMNETFHRRVTLQDIAAIALHAICAFACFWQHTGAWAIIGTCLAMTAPTRM